MAEIPLIAAVDDDEAMREAIQSLIRSVGLGAQVFASAEVSPPRHYDRVGGLVGGGPQRARKVQTTSG
jgi:FixJ family two-component response regulator